MCGTSSLLEALLAPIRIAFWTASEVSIIIDNARNYHNDFVPIMIPFLARAHGFHLRAYVQPETTRGKSVSDAHFVMAMRNVNRYIVETKSDVVKPPNFVSALQSEGGERNRTAELIFVRFSDPGLKTCISGLSFELRALAKLCRMSGCDLGSPAMILLRPRISRSSGELALTT